MKLKELLVLSLLILLVIPISFAEETTEGEEDKSWLGELADSIINKFFGFVLKIFNAPIGFLLGFVKDLMEAKVNTSLFKGVWSVMVYIVSIFYGFGFLYSGFNFMVSGHDPARRANAKAMLRNILIMVVMVQASYLLYNLVLELGTLLTSGVMEMINPDFFLLTGDGFLDVGLDLIFFIPYAIILLVTAVMLTLRYAIVSIGIALFPIGIFLYFFPHTRKYGGIIINTTLINIFITFFCAIFLLAFSKIIEIPIFSELKIIVMICAFLCMNFLILFSFQIAKGDSFKQRASSAASLAVSVAKKVVM